MRTTTQSFSGVLHDKRGMETVEYAVFAVGFLIAIGGFVAAVEPGVVATYDDLGNWIVTQAAALLGGTTSLGLCAVPERTPEAHITGAYRIDDFARRIGRT